MPGPGELRRFLIKCLHFIGPTRAFALIRPHVALRGRLFAQAVWILSARGVLAPVFCSKISQCHVYRTAAVRHGYFPILNTSSSGVPAPVSVSNRLLLFPRWLLSLGRAGPQTTPKQNQIFYSPRCALVAFIRRAVHSLPWSGHIAHIPPQCL